jgi:transposase
VKAIILTQEEKDILRKYFKTTSLILIRLKSQAILLRSKAMKVEDIADVLGRKERTIARWIHEFIEQRLASIFTGHQDNKNAARLTKAQKEQIKKEISLPPSTEGIPKTFWDVPTLKEYVSAQFGVVYESNQSYHYLLKFSNLSFKYPDKRSPHRDEEKIEKRIKEIREEIAPLLSSPQWIVFASDETRVQLEAEIRRAWLVKGKRTIVKTERSKEHQNYLGFLNQKSGQCLVYEIERGNQQETIRVLKTLLNQYPDKRICVIWDNAKWHKGKLLREQLSNGKKLERLHLLAFPPYAPDHNPIEHVWNYGKDKIKNRGGHMFEEIKQAFLASIHNHSFSYQI